MLIQGNSKYGNAENYNYEGEIQIKGRGNASWQQPKKPYKIKLDTSTDVFGFGKNKHWVLLANYRDESLVRNTIANEIAAQMGVVGMDTTWVDVVMNGEYVGNYQFCEQIRIAESRVDIFNWDDEAENIAKAIYKANKNDLTKDDRDVIEDLLTNDYSWVTSGTVIYNDKEYVIQDVYDYQKNISGGYLLELDAYVPAADGEEQEISKFYTNAGMRVVVDKPEYAITNDAMMSYIKTYMQDYEDAIRGMDGYNLEGIHYTQKADFESMVSYWLALEICGNRDAVWRSRWAYKDINGLLTFGPVWDFDCGFGVAGFDSGATGWKLTKGNNVDNFFKEWVDDPYFAMKAQEQYWKIRPYLQSVIDEGGLLDQYNEYLKESGVANENLWKWVRGYQGDADSVKTYLAERLVWLDEQFASQESIMESLRTEYSANPYTKSDDKLIITLDNAAVDNITANAPADGAILKEESLVCKVCAVDGETKTVAVYVNGLKLDENEYIYNLMDGQCSFTIPAERFTEDAGLKNVISLIGRDSEGTATYTNFVSVVVDGNAPPVACCHVNTQTETIAKLPDETTMEKPSNNGIKPNNKTNVSVQNAKGIVVRWNKVKNATYYEIYVAVKGKKYGKAAFTIKASAGRKLTIKMLKGKAVNPEQIYKYKVKAYRTVKGKKKYLTASKIMYVAGKNNKKYTNVSKIVIRKSSYKLKKGEKAAIKATVTKQDKKKKLLPKSYGAKLSYSSSNKKVAVVTKKGKIKAKGKGTCYIHVKSLNGLMKKIKVTVK